MTWLSIHTGILNLIYSFIFHSFIYLPNIYGAPGTFRCCRMHGNSASAIGQTKFHVLKEQSVQEARQTQTSRQLGPVICQRVVKQSRGKWGYCKQGGQRGLSKKVTLREGEARATWVSCLHATNSMATYLFISSPVPSRVLGAEDMSH